GGAASGALSAACSTLVPVSAASMSPSFLKRLSLRSVMKEAATASNIAAVVGGEGAGPHSNLMRFAALKARQVLSAITPTPPVIDTILMTPFDIAAALAS